VILPAVDKLGRQLFARYRSRNRKELGARAVAVGRVERAGRIGKRSKAVGLREPERRRAEFGNPGRALESVIR
jgi:hypothetical protein